VFHFKLKIENWLNVQMCTASAIKNDCLQWVTEVSLGPKKGDPKVKKIEMCYILFIYAMLFVLLSNNLIKLL